MKRVLVLLNPKSGTLAASPTGDEPDRIRRGFAARGVEADVRLVDGGGLAEFAADGHTAAAGTYDAVVAGGGDGTLNCIANAMAGGPVPFGVLPLGTHNHFAREMNVPLDLDAAVAALADGIVGGRATDLDVGEVNGRVFLNFSGLGLHPQFVKERDAQQKAIGGTRVIGRALRKAVKVFAGFIAFFRKLNDLPVMAVRIKPAGTNGQASGGPHGHTLGQPHAHPHGRRRITPSIIVCNNTLQMQEFGVAEMSCPDRGLLNVYVARVTGATGLIRLVLAAFLRRLHTASGRDFESICVPGVRISLRRRHLSVSIDGEVVDLRTPLEYKVRRGGLKVVVPKGNAE